MKKVVFDYLVKDENRIVFVENDSHDLSKDENRIKEYASAGGEE